jgi:cytochrome P450
MPDPTAMSPISFIDPRIQECPYPAMDRLLDEAPVYLDPGTGFYVITRYEDLREILLDPVTYSSGGFLDIVRDSVTADRADRMRRLYEEEGWLPGPSLSMIDDPHHKELRRVFDNAFRAGKIRELEDVVRDTAFELVDSFADKGACDFVRAFAVPFPLLIIGVQMGADKADIWKIKGWTEAWISRLGMMQSEEDERRSVEAEIEGQHFFKGIIDELRRKPNGTVLSDIVNATLADGRYLTDNEIFAHMMADTFVGGSETTTNALAAGVQLLCENPEQYALLRSDPERYMRPFAEEVLRLESPVQGLFRVTTKDVELHGVAIPAGKVLNVRFGGANRDPRHFPCPERLDLERANAGSHLAFGSGVHHCLGAPLARRELYWGFTALLARVDNIRLAPGRNDLKHQPNFMLRALRELHIEYDRRAG